ncbi:MAG: alpha/beta hydrolase [Nannocystaceae bacterium]
MPQAAVGDLVLEYESFGRDDDPPLVLIMGLGCQMVYWPEEFCEALASHGLRVIRFDNRDIGLSTKLDHLGTPNLARILLRGAVKLGGPPPYTLVDMAADVIGLLDALGAQKAHIVGASMGGMVAQEMAIRWPDRVRSLCSWMSTTGELRHSRPTPRALRALIARPGPGREGRIAHALRLMREVGSGPLMDEGWLRDRIGQAYDRSDHWQGTLRHFAACVAAQPRSRSLASVRIPTLVIHGTADRMFPIAAAKATAAAIPGARLALFEGMGHDLPRPLWPRLIDALADHAARA